MPGSIEVQVHPLDLLREIVPDRAWIAVVNALVVGFKKHNKNWDSSRGREKYLDHAQNHLQALRNGETWDRDDRHHHAAAVVIRCLQILDTECAEGG